MKNHGSTYIYDGERDDSLQQNGVTERKNRTIDEIARSMLKAKGILNNLWA